MDLLRAGLGLAFFVGVTWLMSSHKSRVNWRLVLVGIGLQVALAAIILQTGPGRDGLRAFSDLVTRFLSYSSEGAEFVFGPLTQYLPNFTPEEVPPEPVDFPFTGDYDRLPPETAAGFIPVFAFRILPTIIYFSAIMAILYHVGVVQFVVRQLARFMTWSLRVSGAESLAMAANVFVGQTEAPLVVKPYIKLMTRSELMALMTGGFATIAGSVLAAYIGILGPDAAGHLLAASFMSAPAAFVLAKIMLPETQESATSGAATTKLPKETSNVLDAAATGTADGLKLALNVGAMLIAFYSIVQLLDGVLGLVTISGDPLSLNRIFGWVFFPVAWAMGVPTEDCDVFGALLGTKVAVTEFIAFSDLARVGSEGLIGEKSRIMATYALCGFANFASIGIQLGGIGPLAPERRKELSGLVLRAMIGGAFASWMTATIAGAFL